MTACILFYVFYKEPQYPVSAAHKNFAVLVKYNKVSNLRAIYLFENVPIHFNFPHKYFL